MSLSDDVKKVLDDLQVEKRLAEASEAIDRHAGTAVQSLGGYVAAREEHITELIERTAGKVDERTEGRYAGAIDKLRAGLQTGVARIAEKKPDEVPGEAPDQARPTAD